jgi:hypothetical protein
MGSSTVASSRCRRWYSEFRPHLVALVKYTDIPSSGDTWPFVDDARLLSVFDRLRNECGGTISRDVVHTDTTRGSRTLYYKGNAYNYLSVAEKPVPVINADGSRGETSQQGELPFSSVEARNFAYVLLAGRIGLAWWAVLGDDFDVTKRILKGMPGNHSGASQELRAVVAMWAPRIAEAQAMKTVWKLNNGKKVGNWNLAACRDVTDQADLAVLNKIGCTVGEIEAVWTFYHRVYMAGAD